MMMKPVALTLTLMAFLLALPQASQASPSWSGSFASARPGWAAIGTNGNRHGVDFSLAIRSASSRAQGPSAAASLLAGPATSLMELAIRVGAPADPHGELANPDAWQFAVAINEQAEELLEAASAIEEGPGGTHPGASMLRFRFITPTALHAGTKLRLSASHPELGLAFNPSLTLGR